MVEFLLVSALLPTFLLGLVVMGAMQPMGHRHRGTFLSGAAPKFYAVCVLIAVVLALILTGFDTEQLGLGELSILGNRGLAYAVMVPVAAGVALAMFFFELVVASTALNRAQASVVSIRREPPAGSAPHPQLYLGSDDETPIRRTSALTGVLQLVEQPVIYGAIALVTAMGEELLFRGLLLSTLRDHVPVGVALLIQAIMFGANHASFGVRNVLTKSVSGISWGLLTIAFNAIFVAVLSHILFQYLVFRRLARQLESHE